MISRLFADVQKCLQKGIFPLEAHRTCSPLFAWVGVRLVSTGVGSFLCSVQPGLAVRLVGRRVGGTPARASG